MTFAFSLIVLVMIIIALATLLVPMLRNRRAAVEPGAGPGQASATPVVAIIAVALLLPALTLLLYRSIGVPQALNPLYASQTADRELDLDAAVAALEQRLQAEPGDINGWMLLSRAYLAMERFDAAHDAVRKAHELAPDDLDVMVEYAQAIALAAPQQRIEGEARRVLQDVLQRAPDHQKALWLVGISEFQAADFQAAIDTWTGLLELLPPGSDAVPGIEAQIAQARSLLAGAASAPEMPSPGDHSVRLTIQVDVADGLAAAMPADASVFIFARTVDGSPMPIAIERLQASQLPATVVLDDSKSMLPQLRLSMVDRVVIGARISATGDALPRTGDLQGFSDAVDVTTRAPIEVRISEIVP